MPGTQLLTKEQQKQKQTPHSPGFLTDDSETKHGLLDFYLSSWASKSVVSLLGLPFSFSCLRTWSYLDRVSVPGAGSRGLPHSLQHFCKPLNPCIQSTLSQIPKVGSASCTEHTANDMNCVRGPIDWGQGPSYSGGSNFHASSLTHGTWHACSLNCPCRART